MSSSEIWNTQTERRERERERVDRASLSLTLSPSLAKKEEEEVLFFLFLSLCAREHAGAFLSLCIKQRREMISIFPATTTKNVASVGKTRTTMSALFLLSFFLSLITTVRAIRPFEGGEEHRDQFCANTKQGLHHITDDNGYTCNWFDLESKTGCCPPSKAIEKRFGCAACDLTPKHETEKCCQTYESCVACCQNAKVSTAEIDRTREPIGRAQPSTGYFSDAFSHCKSKCRTQPSVTVHESTYGYERKFCFGKFPRDKDPTPPRGFKP